jgi:hypothetical protein
MKKLILLVIGVLCISTYQPFAEARADDQVSETGDLKPRFVVKNHQNFTRLENCGLSVSVDGPDVVIKCGDTFFAFHEDQWYIANKLSGPWVLISKTALPASIREHGRE